MSNRMYGAMFGMALLVMVAPAHAQDATPTASATIIDNSGATIGEASLIESNVGVLIRLTLDGVAPGWHAIHIHEIGNCDDTDRFMNSGGHFNVYERAHGLLNPDGPDNGDLPNVYAHADGSVRVEMLTPLVSLKGPDRPAVLDYDGSALVMHTNPDDHVTQPIGGAGARIACGVITPSE